MSDERQHCPFCGEGYGSENDPCLKGAWEDRDAIDRIASEMIAAANLDQQDPERRVTRFDVRGWAEQLRGLGPQGDA